MADSADHDLLVPSYSEPSTTSDRRKCKTALAVTINPLIPTDLIRGFDLQMSMLQIRQTLRIAFGSLRGVCCQAAVSPRLLSER